MRKISTLVILLTTITLVGAVGLRADKSDVEIDAPASAAKGSTITITVKVIHHGNNFFHYTDWVWVRVNGKEAGRWDFSRSKRPEAEVFTRTVQVVVDGPLDITAQANCNIHGSVGQHAAKTAVK